MTKSRFIKNVDETMLDKKECWILSVHDIELDYWAIAIIDKKELLPFYTECDNNCYAASLFIVKDGFPKHSTGMPSGWVSMALFENSRKEMYEKYRNGTMGHLFLVSSFGAMLNLLQAHLVTQTYRSNMY